MNIMSALNLLHAFSVQQTNKSSLLFLYVMAKLRHKNGWILYSSVKTLFLSSLGCGDAMWYQYDPTRKFVCV